MTPILLITDLDYAPIRRKNFARPAQRSPEQSDQRRAIFDSTALWRPAPPGGDARCGCGVLATKPSGGCAELSWLRLVTLSRPFQVFSEGFWAQAECMA
jgi:hypothetical protein